MNKLVLITLFFSFCCCFCANGQQTFSININKHSGLPSPIVYDFIQDSKGFIWIASNAGLTRYDGFEFITYTSNEQTSLPGSQIREDRYGRIWYQNFDGYLYYLKDDVLKPLKQNKPGEYVPFGIVGDFLFVVQQNGVDVLDLKTLRFLRTIPVQTSNVISSTVLKDAFYFLANNIVYRIGKDFKLSKTHYFEQENIKVNHINNDSNQLFLTYRNTDSHNLYFVNPDLRFDRKLTLDSKGWILTNQYLNKHYVLYTNNGFYIYDKRIKLVLSNDLLKLDPFINKCVVDRRGNYWFSSLKSGLHLITDFNNKMFEFPGYEEFRNMVQLSDGYLISTQKGTIIETDLSFQFRRKVLDLGEKVQISNFIYDEERDYLFFTTSSGLHIYHQNKQIYLADFAAKDGLKLDNDFYAVTASGFVFLMKNPALGDKQSTSIWNTLYEKNIPNGQQFLAPVLSNLRARSIDFYEDKNTFIVSTNVGLFVVDSLGAKELLIENKPFYASEIFCYNKKIYLQDNIGNLHVVYRSGKLSSLNAEIGIPTNSIKFIKRFGNTLYIVCPNRIFEYDLTYSTSKTFSFNINMLTITDLVKTEKNLVLVSGKHIVSIDLNKKSIQNNLPHFYFSNYYVGTEQVSTHELNYLSTSQNSIRITYSLLDYGSNVEPQVSYRLNKGQWVKQVAGSREIQLISLSPGVYELEIRMNNTILEDKVIFKILSPIYLRWWFILSILGLIVLASLMIYIWRLYLLQTKIKRLNEKLVLQNQLRTSMLTSIKAQMNPHFFYNALNTIQSYIFSNDKYHATTYLAKFSKLTRRILEMSGQSTIKLEDEVSALQLYLELEQMRFQRDFSFQLEVDDSIDSQTMRIPSMLIQPYVENAIKHGLLHREGEKWVRIQFMNRADFLEIAIEDNGVGRKRSEEINQQKPDKPKSFSTESNQMRLDLINQGANLVSVQFEDKIDKKGAASGTKVTLYISKQTTWQ